VGDTSSSFHSVIDVQFSSDASTGGNTDGDCGTDDTSSGGDNGSNGDTESDNNDEAIVKQVGSINPSMNLSTGDVVSVRKFTQFGELVDRQIDFQISSNANGEATNWPLMLAQSINDRGLEISTGIPDMTTMLITPQLGMNLVYANPTSSIVRVETGFTFINAQGANEDDDQTNNDSPDIPTHPEGMGTYAVGDHVLNASGDRYQCQVSDWCNISEFYYAPGEGLAWQLAWALVTESSSDSSTPSTAEHAYPDERGCYSVGSIVSNEGVNYRCKVQGWCNNSIAYCYAPGTGTAWTQAWDMM